MNGNKNTYILNALHSSDLFLLRYLKQPISDPQFIHLLEAEPLYIHWKATVSLHFERVQGRICDGLNSLLPKVVV